MVAAFDKPPPLRIFPLHGILPGPACTCPRGEECPDIGKHPLVEWRAHEEGGKGPSGGFGIQTGRFNGIFVVDLDESTKNGKKKEGIAAFLTLANGREIPDTLSVKTPTGGVHLYFRLPPDVYVPKSIGVLAPGVDILGEGGYVVGPSSPHRCGGTYEEVPGELADPPQWLLDLVVKTPEPPKLLETKHHTVDPASPEGMRAIAWAKNYLTKAEPAIQGQGGSNTCFHVCCDLMLSALPLGTLRNLFEEVYNSRCVPPWSRREIDHKLADADRRSDKPRGLAPEGFLDRMYKRTKETTAREPDPLHEYTFHPGMRGSNETRKATFGEIVQDLTDHVEWAGVLQFDTFRNRIVAIDPPMPLDAETSGLTDADVQRIRAWLEFHGKKLNTQDVRAAIETVAREKPFNALQDWLQSLEWDGRPRLDQVLPNYFQSADGLYERGIGPRWFISLVARAMRPGCQSDCTLVLEGPQGIGKTSAFRALMQEPRWYAQSSCGVDSKDFLENLRGVWLMGFDELDSLTRASMTRVNKLLTDISDHYRQSYGHYADDYLRSCGFCGSTNAEQYWNDMTGARRLWPVLVLRPINVQRIRDDRNQLWAEAHARWKAGEVWHVDTPELRALCEGEQEARLEVDGWEEIIRRWFNDPTKFSRAAIPEEPGSVFRGVRPFDGSRGVTTGDVLEHAIGKLRGQWTRGDSIRVGRILQRRKMKRIQARLADGEREWRYVFSTSSE